MISWRLLCSELRHVPPPRVWGISFAGTALLLGAAALVMPDFMDLGNRPGLTTMLQVAAVGLIFPAFFEEVVFRGLLNSPKTRFSALLSTVLFVLWHPFEAWVLFPDAAEIFLDGRFLLFVALFGLWFCWIHRLGRSLWPPIVCHWLIVLVWKGLGGARFITY